MTLAPGSLVPANAAAAALAAPADPVLAAAYWTGVGALVLTLLLGAQIIRLRIALRARQRREAQALARWRPIFNAVIVGEPPATLPALTKAERPHFIKLWVHLQASLRGEASDALKALARRLDVERDARVMLVRGPRTERLLATLLLGHLGDRDSWDTLRTLAGSPDVTLSLSALWALVRIDPHAAAAYLTPLFVERDDWAMSHVAGILKEASAPVAGVLAALLPTLAPERVPRALRIAEALRIDLPADMLAAAMAGDDVALVTAALRIVATPDARDQVRGLLAHPDWQVRVLAAKALGRIGDASDVGRLATLLGDREWWVRYRAAQAIVELPWLGPADLDALHASLSDRFAADIFAQVIAETRSLERIA